MPSEWIMTQEVKHLPRLHHPLFIEGLPGIGNVGKIAVDVLIDELNAKKLYSFFSYKFPHSVFVNEKNLVDMPKLELYRAQAGKGKKKQDLLLLTGDIQPIDEESCYRFCEEILQLLKRFSCTEIVTTGGVGLQNIPEKPLVYCTANDPLLLKEYKQKQLHVETRIFGVVGPIIGVTGILLGLGQRHKVKGVALLAETFAHPLYLGVKGAKEILRVLEAKFKLGLDLKKMSKEILEMETEIMKKTQEWAAEMSHTKAGAKKVSQEANYIG
ncbi:PAC2 family protein [Candidatus Woesearchaeota archaeon]|nr:PAC2 family protein [Candidatus Woesearchaeota archaeon]